MMNDLISREEAVSVCSCLHPEDCWEAIRNLPSVSAEPTTRERKETKSTLLTLKHLFEDEEILKALDVAIECVSAEPMTEEKDIKFLQETGWMQEHDKWMSEPKRGEWVLTRTERICGKDVPTSYKCSECGSEQGFVWMNYCPNCGAKMGVSE